MAAAADIGPTIPRSCRSSRLVLNLSLERMQVALCDRPNPKPSPDTYGLAAGKSEGGGGCGFAPLLRQGRDPSPVIFCSRTLRRTLEDYVVIIMMRIIEIDVRSYCPNRSVAGGGGECIWRRMTVNPRLV